MLHIYTFFRRVHQTNCAIESAVGGAGCTHTQWQYSLRRQPASSLYLSTHFSHQKWHKTVTSFILVTIWSQFDKTQFCGKKKWNNILWQERDDVSVSNLVWLVKNI